MAEITRLSISIDERLLERFDTLTREKGYFNRSEAIRDLIRDFLVQEEWDAGEEETMGVVTLVFDHHVRELASHLTDLQHHSHEQVVSTLHIHLDHDNCLEVIIVRGKSREIRSLADRLIGTRGVKHGRLTMATSGKGLV